MAKRQRKLVLTGTRGRRMTKPAKVHFTKDRQETFLAELAATCNVTASSAAAGVSTTCVYNHRRKNAAFRAGWAEAVREAYARLELMTLERMMNGTVTTRTRADGSVDKTHSYPTAVALQLLRLHKSSAAEAAVEHDPVAIEEVRERVIRRLARLRARMAKEAAAKAQAARPGEPGQDR